MRSFVISYKKPTDSTTGTASGKTDTTSGQTSTASGQTSTTNGRVLQVLRVTREVLQQQLPQINVLFNLRA